MTAGRGAVFAMATLLGACDRAPTAAPDPRAELKAVREDNGREAERLRAALTPPWAARLPTTTMFRQRLFALDRWIADADAQLAAGADAEVDARLAADGGTLVRSKARAAPALDAVASFSEAITRAEARGAGIKRAVNEIGAHGDARVQLRFESWRDALRTTEEAFSRALRRLVEDPPDLKGSEMDFKIASAGYAEAETAGGKLQEELDALAAASTDAGVRRDHYLRRLEWAERVATAAGDGLAAEARSALEAGRRYREDLMRDTAATLAKIGSAAPDALEEVRRLTVRTDSALQSLTRAFLDLARRLKVGDPPS
jgi:hypothetical protein